MRHVMSLVVISVCSYGTAAAQVGNLGGGVTGGASAPGRGLSGSAEMQSRAAVRLNAANRGADARQLGPNFDAARMGADAGVRTTAGRRGLHASGRAGVSAEATHQHDGRQHDRPSRPDDRAAASQRFENRNNHAAMQADLFLANRLADIDRLRDIALANGDTNLLLRTDALEHQARVQHRHQIEQAFAAGANADRRPWPIGHQQVQGEANGAAAAAGQYGVTTAEQARYEGRQHAASYDQQADVQGGYEMPSLGNFDYPPPRAPQFQSPNGYDVDSRGYAGFQGHADAGRYADEVEAYGQYGLSAAGRSAGRARGAVNSWGQEVDARAQYGAAAAERNIGRGRDAANTFYDEARARGEFDSSAGFYGNVGPYQGPTRNYAAEAEGHFQAATRTGNSRRPAVNGPDETEFENERPTDSAARPSRQAPADAVDAGEQSQTQDLAPADERDAELPPKDRRRRRTGR